MTKPYLPIRLYLPALSIGLLAACSENTIEYTGLLEHRPEGKDGMWVISGRSFSVTQEVELDEDNGALTVGACVELEMQDSDVKEIESTDIAKCRPEQT